MDARDSDDDDAEGSYQAITDLTLILTLNLTSTLTLIGSYQAITDAQVEDAMAVYKLVAAPDSETGSDDAAMTREELVKAHGEQRRYLINTFAMGETLPICVLTLTGIETRIFQEEISSYSKGLIRISRGSSPRRSGSLT